MDKNAIKDVIYDLIKVNNDRIEGYKTAISEIDTKEQDLITLFTDFINNSQKNKDALVSIAPKMGVESTDDTANTGKLYRLWMDVKAAISTDTRQAVLESCEFGEDAALKVYNSIENHAEEIPAELVELTAAQKIIIKQDHDRVKKLRDREKASA